MKAIHESQTTDADPVMQATFALGAMVLGGDLDGGVMGMFGGIF